MQTTVVISWARTACIHTMQSILCPNAVQTVIVICIKSTAGIFLCWVHAITRTLSLHDCLYMFATHQAQKDVLRGVLSTSPRPCADLNHCTGVSTSDTSAMGTCSKAGRTHVKLMQCWHEHQLQTLGGGGTLPADHALNL